MSITRIEATVTLKSSRNSWSIDLERWRKSASAKQYTYGGEPVGPRDKGLLSAMLVYMGALYTDFLSTKSFVEGPGYDAWLNSFVTFDAQEFGLLTKKVDEALKALCNRPRSEWVGVMGYHRFKRDVGYPSIHWRYIACIKPMLEGFLSTGEHTYFHFCNTWINFPRRVNLDVDLTLQCEKEYVDFENALHAQTYCDDTVEALTDIISEWFDGFSLADFWPKHGPGSVSGYVGRLSPVEKHRVVEVDASLRYLGKYVGDISDFLPLGAAATVNRVSELVCVPKSLISNRTISREPAALQYFQQGVRSSMLAYINSHPYLRSHLRLDDQTASQDLCRIGSVDGSYATVDLSSASDSVTKTLVYRVFRRVKPLQFALCCTRGHYTRLSDGTEVHLEKFAPMGSATCFVVMSVIIAAICEVALRRARLAAKREGERRPGISRKYLVYGDDIIIDSGVWEDLLGLLTELHFKVNTTKSYYTQSVIANFREACGAEYMDGHDVAPIRIPRFFAGPAGYQSLAGVAVASYASFANNAFRCGWMHLRSSILNDMFSLWPRSRYLMYDSDGRMGIQTYEDTCTNFHVPARLGRLHRTQYKCTVLVARPDCRTCRAHHRQTVGNRRCDEGSDEWESVRYFEALTGSAARDPVSTYDYSIGVVDVRPHSYCRSSLILETKWVYGPLDS